MQYNSVNTSSLNRHAEISTSDDVFPLSWLRKRQHWAPLNISLHSILPTYLFLRHLYLVNHIWLFNNKAFERLAGVKAYLTVLHLKQIILNPYYIPKKRHPTTWGTAPFTEFDLPLPETNKDRLAKQAQSTQKKKEIHQFQGGPNLPPKKCHAKTKGQVSGTWTWLDKSSNDTCILAFPVEG